MQVTTPDPPLATVCPALIDPPRSTGSFSGLGREETARWIGVISFHCSAVRWLRCHFSRTRRHAGLRGSASCGTRGALEKKGLLHRTSSRFRDLGYVEGRNVHFEHRFPNELPERFRSMMAYQQRANIAKMTVERRLPLGVWSK
jgi:hypothetical protein